VAIRTTRRTGGRGWCPGVDHSSDVLGPFGPLRLALLGDRRLARRVVSLAAWGKGVRIFPTDLTSKPLTCENPVGDTGIEPVTSSVSGKRSPAELIARSVLHERVVPRGGNGIRTRVNGFAGRCLASRPSHQEGSQVRKPEPLPSGRRDSNPRPSPWQGDALPTALRPPTSRPTGAATAGPLYPTREAPSKPVGARPAPPLVGPGCAGFAGQIAVRDSNPVSGAAAPRGSDHAYKESWTGT
jgi:hypothetical protein